MNSSPFYFMILNKVRSCVRPLRDGKELLKVVARCEHCFFHCEWIDDWPANRSRVAHSAELFWSWTFVFRPLGLTIDSDLSSQPCSVFRFSRFPFFRSRVLVCKLLLFVNDNLLVSDNLFFFFTEHGRRCRSEMF